MAPLDPLSWVLVVNASINLGVMLVGIKLVRHLSFMELKVDLMWIQFQRLVDNKKERDSNGLT